MKRKKGKILAQNLFSEIQKKKLVGIFKVGKKVELKVCVSREVFFVQPCLILSLKIFFGIQNLRSRNSLDFSINHLSPHFM